jgi:GTPase SAR1 family protein
VGIIESQALSELHAAHELLAELCVGGSLAFKRALRALRGIERHLARPVRIAVLGEENSGKSLFLNYLLRHQILPTSSFSPDDTEILVRYAAEPSVYVVNKDGHRARLTSRAFGALSKAEARQKPQSSNIIYQASNISAGDSGYGNADTGMMFARPRNAKPPSRLIDVGLPIEMLKHVEMIEVRTIPESKSMTPAAIAYRQVDISIWCTLATQAWKETEAMSWRRVPPVRRQSALMLVTYKDAINDRQDEIKILERLYRATPSLFSDIQLVSFKDAVASLLENEEERAHKLRDASNIEGVERSLVTMVEARKAHRLRKASRLLRIIAANLSSVEERNAGRDQKRRAVAERLDQIADMLPDIAPSVSLQVEAA